MKRIAICPGSFDPVTNGHLDIITRASAIFDQVIALVLINPEKQTTFSVTERLDMLTRSTAHMDGVVADAFDGLLVDYAKLSGATAIVKGLRAVTDFEYEFQMALMNKKLAPNVETLFLTTDLNNMFLSSSIVKQLYFFGDGAPEYVPAVIRKDIEKKLLSEKKERLK